jgi:excisionase family DNA binding protein
MDLRGVLTTTEAAQRLGLSEREVSRLAWSGALTATKRGSVWWIDADAVARRARERPATGRPLSPATAWAVLLLASGRSEWRSLTEHGHGHEPRRAQTWLATHPLVDNAFRLQRRARRESFDAHPSELRRIAARPDVMRTGISASAEIGVHGGRGKSSFTRQSRCESG